MSRFDRPEFLEWARLVQWEIITYGYGVLEGKQEGVLKASIIQVHLYIC